MARPRTVGADRSMTVRVPGPWPELVAQAAEARGMTSSEWMRRVVERGLIGEGLLLGNVERRGADREVTPLPKKAKR